MIPNFYSPMQDWHVTDKNQLDGIVLRACRWLWYQSQAGSYNQYAYPYVSAYDVASFLGRSKIRYGGNTQAVVTYRLNKLKKLGYLTSGRKGYYLTEKADPLVPVIDERRTRIAQEFREKPRVNAQWFNDMVNIILPGGGDFTSQIGWKWNPHLPPVWDVSVEKHGEISASFDVGIGTMKYILMKAKQQVERERAEREERE